MNSAAVKIEGPANTGDLHRAINLSKKLQEAGEWDGEASIVWASAKTVVNAIGQTQLYGKLMVNSDDYKVLK